MEIILQRLGNEFIARIPLDVARKKFSSSGYRAVITPIDIKFEKNNKAKSKPRKGWAKTFAKTGGKEKLIVSDKIKNENFEWEW